MKRILCLIDSLASGGAERQMSYLSVGLKDSGYDVKLVVFSDFADFYKEYAESHGVTIEINLNGRNKFRRILEIRKLVKSYKPDAVIAYKDGVTMAACLAKIITNFKLIVSERNTTQELSNYDRLKFFLYRYADWVVPNSSSQGEFIKTKYKNLSSKVKVIRNTIDTDYFVPGDKDNENSAYPIILTTARVMAQKNTLRYLEAIAKVHNKNPHVRFRWVGYCEDAYYNQVMEKVEELKLKDVIEFRSAVKDVAAVYRDADFYCLPSLYEGFPNVVCEAMACGLPVVCSRVCDNPDIVEDGINGLLFDPNDSFDIADKILRIVDMSKYEYSAMSENNSAKINNICSPKRFISEYNSIL